MVDANIIAHLALALWPLVCLLLYLMLRPPVATAVAMLGGTLFLPEKLGFDLPAIPPLTKYTLTPLCCFVWYALLGKPRMKLRRYPVLVALAVLVGAVGTWRSNPEIVFAGPMPLPALTTADLRADTLRGWFEMALPLALGMSAFRSADDLRTLLRVIAIGGILYVPLVLFELRISPQLHIWVYGYFAHSFEQMIRDGGFRPMVFLYHGLGVSKFLHEAMSAAALTKDRPILGLSGFTWALIIFVVTILAKSVAPMIYCFVTLLGLKLLTAKTQTRIAWIIVILVAVYPILRITRNFPWQDMVALAGDLTNPDRAESLHFRFNNEEMLTDRILMRPWFGWGAQGRQFVFDEDGIPQTVVDSLWVIEVGRTGAFGGVLIWIILATPIWKAMRSLKRVASKEESRLLAGVALVLGISWLDLLINGWLTTHNLLLSGALLGWLHTLPKRQVRKIR